MCYLEYEHIIRRFIANNSPVQPKSSTLIETFSLPVPDREARLVDITAVLTSTGMSRSDGGVVCNADDVNVLRWRLLGKDGVDGCEERKSHSDA